MKRIKIIFLCVLASQFVFAQNVISSTAYIQTCIDKTNCFSEKNTSYVFYDDAKNELILKIDFTKIKNDNDSVVDWMVDLSVSNFYFIAGLKNTEFAGFLQNSSKTLKLDGTIYFNEVWQNTSIELVIFQSSENSLLTQNINGNAYDTYKVNFGLSFLPKDFKIHKGPHHLKKIITIGVASGRINQLKPEMQGLIKDIPKKNN